MEVEEKRTRLHRSRRAVRTKTRRDWTCLPLFIVDRLALTLKASRRWKSDGPSLRLVNKRWCTALDNNVFKIRPHSQRVLVHADLISLLKFRCLMTVDVSPFIVSGPSVQKRCQNKSMTCRSCWYGRESKRIVDVLYQLPHLSRIEISEEALLLWGHRCEETKEQWSRLKGITSLYCYHFRNLKLYGDTPMNTTWTRLLSGRRDVSKCLKELTSSLHSLQVLEVHGSILGPRTKLRFLERIESIEVWNVQYMRQIRCLSSLSMKTSSAQLRRKESLSFENLLLLEDLKALGLWFIGPAVLDDRSLPHVLQRLRVLDLRLTRYRPFLPNHIFSNLCGLECLNLSNCSVNGEAMLEHLCGLKALRVSWVTVIDANIRFLRQLNRLEVLNWFCVYQSNGQVLHLPLRKSMFPKLWSLCTARISTDTDLARIAKRTNLEVLSIKAIGKYVTISGLHELERLQNLRVFRATIKDISLRNFLPRLLSLKIFRRLEQLWLDIGKEGIEKSAKALQNLRKESPRLIIEAGDQLGGKRHQHFFENACFM